MLCKYFPQFPGCIFILLIVSFAVQKLSSITQSPCSLLPWWPELLVFQPNPHCQSQLQKALFQCFQVLIYFEFIFLYIVRVQGHSLGMWLSCFSKTIYQWDYPFPITPSSYTCPKLCWSQSWVYFLAVCSIPLNYVFAFMQYHTVLINIDLN